jgi:hypothetical protein
MILLTRKQLYGIQKVNIGQSRTKVHFPKKKKPNFFFFWTNLKAKKEKSFALVTLEEMAQRHSAQEVRFPCPTDFFLEALGPVKLLIMPKFLSKLYKKKKCQY